LSPGVAVGPAHESITDQRDVKFSHDLPGLVSIAQWRCAPPIEMQAP
jgi:hypothetical protein